MEASKIYLFKNYLVEKYGHPLYRIPINLAFSCPNRVANSGKGCIFCAEDGATARHLKHNLNLKEQVETGIKYVNNRYKTKAPYIAYFQAYTNTNADIATIRKLYEEVLSSAEFAMVIIATRPDCLPDEVLEYLKELNERYDLWIELGVQTSNDESLKYINRGHDFNSVKVAVNKLNDLNIKTAAHIILGLPNEDICDFRKTAQDISALPFSGIKIHNLLVLKKTELATIYRNEKFKVYNEYEYAEILLDFLKYIPKDWPLMRITAESDEKTVIAPKWWMKKGQFFEYIKQEFVWKQSTFSKVKTEDGSYTFYHPKFKQHFHTTAGAKSEAIEKFIKPSKIFGNASCQLAEINLLDIGFGLGYNVFETIKFANSAEYKGQLNIVSLEYDIKTLEIALSVYENNSLEYLILQELIKNKVWIDNNIKIEVVIKDARTAIQEIDLKFDYVFMDGFSPDKNPELWSYDFVKAIKNHLAKNAVIVTYSSANPVKGAFLRNDFFLGETKPYGRKKGGVIASLNSDLIQNKLSKKELNIILKSTTGIAYRDIKLKSTKKEILSLRDKTTKKLKKLGVPKWYVNND